MKKSLAALSIASLFAVPAFAQHERGGGGGHFPSGPPHGPTPVHAPPPAPHPVAPPHPVAHPEPARPEPAHPVVERPRVENDGRWVGHDRGREDERYHVGKPWPHGRWKGPIGAGHVYRIGGWEAAQHRFWFGSSYWIVSPNDYGYVDDWDWANDNVVIYDDPDHEGWYLAYNPRLGTYIHVEYDGAMQ
jgi:hypothetical protein